MKHRIKNWATWLLLLGILLAQNLLSAGRAEAFPPTNWKGLGSNTHQSITESAITDLDIAYFSVRSPTKSMRKALSEIVDANSAVDDDQVNSAKHFDGENFADGQSRVVDLFKLVLTDLKDGDGKLARFDLGQALHTIQDFYAHSNWVELGNTAPSPDLGRPGHTLGPVAGPTEVTCDGSTLKTSKLTSGYYGGEDRKPVIAGKCRHGGPFDRSPGSGGINKDTLIGGRRIGKRRLGQLSPHFTLHDTAARLAKEATKQFIEDIKAKVTPKQLRLLLGALSLGISIDTTGSMRDIIDGVKGEAIRIVDGRLNTPEEPSKYVLAPFNDPRVGPLVATNDADAFKKAISGLPAEGGHDCPELSMSGALEALSEIDEGGDLFLFTDASSKDGDLVGNVSGLAQSKDIAIYPMIFGSCSPLDPAYVKLADDTGGQVFNLAHEDAGAVAQLADFLVRPNAVSVLSAAGDLGAAPRSFSVPVDSTMSRVTFSATGADEVTVTRPDGTVVRDGDPGTQFVALSPGSGPAAILTVTKPAAGAWKITLGGSGPFSLTATGESPLEVLQFRFVRTGGRPGFERIVEVPGFPAGGQASKADVTITDGIQSHRVELRALDGSVLQTLNLQAVTSTELFGQVRPPSVPFRAYVTGTDQAGHTVQRAMRGVERPQPMVVTAPPSADLRSGQATSFRFEVHNFGPADTFAVSVADERRFGTSVTPAKVSMGSGKTASVTVQVRTPCTAANRLLDTLTMTVRSTARADVTNFAVLTNSVSAATPHPCAAASHTSGPPSAGLPMTGNATFAGITVAVVLLAAGTALLLVVRLHRIRFRSNSTQR